jgi:hypothetical protein
MTTNDTVIDTFATVLREAGFEKKQFAWYRRTPEMIVVVDLQRSKFGLMHFCNVGFWLRELGDEIWPELYECHVHQRWDHTLTPDEISVLRVILDLVENVPGETRETTLRKAIKERLLPYLDQGSSVSGLRAIAKEGLPGLLVREEALSILAETA